MATRYYCGSDLRRDLVRNDPAGKLNGIDYVEVLDQDRPAGAPRRRTLLVHCIRPLPSGFQAAAAVTGGVRASGVGCQWISPAQALSAADVAKGQITTAELAFYQASGLHPDRLLVVRTDSAGDLSTYTLSLLGADGNPPPAQFDPILSQVEFSFAADESSGFDCKSEGVAGSARDGRSTAAGACGAIPVSPELDYLAKDYTGFRRLMLDRLSALVPGWRERNPASMSVMLVELLAYAADQLSYYQDAVATEAYLGTARRRISVRRHARLVDYLVHDGCNARVWLHLEVQGEEVLLPRLSADQTPVRFLTRSAQDSVVAPSRLSEVLLQHRPEVFELMHDAALYEAHNTIRLHTWGETEFWLPKGARRATLRDDADRRLRLCAGDVLVFQEVRSPETGEEHDADHSHVHAVRLTRVSPEGQRLAGAGDRRVPSAESAMRRDPLLDQPVVEVEWDEADALPFSLCVCRTFGGKPIDTAVALGNVALADHGLSTGPSRLPPIAEGARSIRIDAPLATCRVQNETAEVRALPASRQLVQDPRQALPDLILRSLDPTDERPVWGVRRDLLSSGPFDQVFVAEAEGDGSLHLRFGDDVLGERPNIGTEFQAHLRTGNGLSGNVSAGAIQHVVSSDSGIVRVVNPLPASGGVDPEPLDQVRLQAPVAFRRQERAVTEQDYAEAAERYPEVLRAVATLRWTGSWHTMFVTAEHVRGHLAPQDFLGFRERLRAFLEPLRLAGHDVEVDAPRYVPLDIALTVRVAPGYLVMDVKRALMEAFSNRLLPDGRQGFFHPGRFSFGQPLYLSQMVAAAMAVPGVLWVDAAPRSGHRFQRFGSGAAGEIEAGEIDVGRLEIIRLDNDPSLPENGRLQFLMEGGR